MSSASLHLGLDTATAWLSLALHDPGSGTDLGRVQLLAERRHASLVHTALQELLAGAGAVVQDIGAIGVGTGPGSYTGLRVGLATARGLATGLDCLLSGSDSLAAAAWGALTPGGRAWLAFDARRGNLYAASFERTETGLLVHAPPQRIASAELHEQAAAQGLQILLDRAPDAAWTARQAASGDPVDGLYL